MEAYALNEWRNLLGILIKPTAEESADERLRLYLEDEKTQKLLAEIAADLKNDWKKFTPNAAPPVSPKVEIAQIDRLIPFSPERPASKIPPVSEESPPPMEPKTDLPETPPTDSTITQPEQKSEPMNKFSPTVPPPPPPRPVPVRVNLRPVKMNESVDIDLDDLPEIKWADILEASFEEDDIQSIGLVYEPATRRLSGKPTQQGEFILDFIYKSTREEGWLGSKFILFVNPDPRSLWKNEPTNPDLPYQKTDFDKAADRRGERTLVAASVRGRSHAHEGKFRDDDFFLEADAASGWYFLAVADGAGSAKYSRKGSELACQSARDFLKDSLLSGELSRFEEAIRELKKSGSLTGDENLLFQKLLVSAAFEAHKTIEREMAAPTDEKMPAEPPATLRDYSTTFLLAIAKKFEFGWFVGAFGVGDGGIGIYRPGQEPLLLAEPDGGEFAGQTRFLTMPEIFNGSIYARFKYHFLPADADLTALILMTDGVTDPKFPTDNSLKNAAVWADFWKDLSENVRFEKGNENLESELLEWLNFWSPGNHDDRTIALLF